MRFISFLIAAVTVLSTSASAIDIGDTAPLFSQATYGGGTFDLAQQKGKVTVLLFLCYQ
jgi:cytochrome oxidase Cu insertion factor (SCO1/SenC/PrrC family)